MPRSVWQIALALALTGAGSTSVLAWWDRCNCQPPAFYPPPPAYIYDHTTGPSWSANGWSYPPVGVYYPVPMPPALVAAPYPADYLAPRFADPGPAALRLPMRGRIQPLK